MIARKLLDRLEEKDDGLIVGIRTEGEEMLKARQNSRIHWFLNEPFKKSINGIPSVREALFRLFE